MEGLTASVKDIALALIVPGDAILARAKQEAWPVVQGSGASTIFKVADLPEEIRPLVVKRLLKKQQQRPIGDEHTIQQLADYFGRSRVWVNARSKDENWPFELRNGRKIFKLSEVVKAAERAVKKKTVKKTPTHPSVNEPGRSDAGMKPGAQEATANIALCFENIERIASELSQEAIGILKALNRRTNDFKKGSGPESRRLTKHFFLRRRRMKGLRGTGDMK
jgi:hypothetical protein